MNPFTLLPVLRPMGRRRMRARPVALLVALLLTSAWPAASAEPLDDMRRLVESGQLEQAYASALRTPELIGDVHFDFLFGLAAVGTGHVPEGLLALERHLAAVPANDRARLELAQGYFQIGEFGRARSEFEFVLRYNPPEGVRANIARFMQAMALRDAAQGRSSARLYAEFGGGHDSNVNGGTFRDELLLPSGPPVSLGGLSSQGKADNFYQVAVGGQQTLRVSNRMSAFLSLDLDVKHNIQLREFDLSTVGLNTGFSLISGTTVYRGTLSVSTLLVGSKRYRDSLTLGVEANLNLSPTWPLMVFGQFAEFRHAGADSVRDGRATTLGAMVTRSFADLPGTPSVGLRLSWTQEDNNSVLRPDLSRNLPLLRLFAAASPAERWRINAGFTAFNQHFGANDVVFGSTRFDASTGLDFNASYAMTPQWTLRGEWLLLKNRSNQSLYDSNRQSLALKARYQY